MQSAPREVASKKGGRPVQLRPFVRNSVGYHKRIKILRVVYKYRDERVIESKI